MNKKTRVRFYREDRAVLAVFPDHTHHTAAGIQQDCYSFTEGHSHSQPAYHHRLPKARKIQYQPLADHLSRIGYDLNILNQG